MSLVIFDFDGTIGDSFEYVYEFMAGEVGNRRPKAELVEAEYRQLSMKDMALKMGIPFWRLPTLYFRGRRVMREHILKVKPFADMPQAIRALHDDGHRLAIISANSSRNVRQFLKQHNLEQDFVAIKGNAGFLGKVSPIKNFCRRYDTKDCWYIGDEVADIASAKAAGVKVIAVTWGFAGRNNLHKFDPTALVDRAKDIPRIINAAQQEERHD